MIQNGRITAIRTDYHCRSLHLPVIQYTFDVTAAKLRHAMPSPFSQLRVKSGHACRADLLGRDVTIHYQF